MYKISKLCGINDYSVIFDKKIDIKGILNFFKDYRILEESDETARLVLDNKKILIYSYGEIIFMNFNIDEVEEICQNLEKILK